MYQLANITNIFVALFSLILVSSCGGGGDSGTGGSGGGAGTQNHIVSATAGAGGTISPASRTVVNGQTTTFTVSANTGYSINSVSGCGGSLSGTTYTTGSVTSACTVNASFSLNSYNVIATAGEGGSITPVSQTVNHGETADFTVVVDDGYVIGIVSGCNGDLNGNIYTTGEITISCNVSAQFEPLAISGETPDGSVISVELVSTGASFTSDSKGFIPVSGHPDSPALPLPESISMPYGLLDFTARLENGIDTLQLAITYPNTLPQDIEYWKFGKQNQSASEAYWYSLPTSMFTVSEDRRTVILSLTDGALGDNDLEINGIITDPGGVVVPNLITVTASASEGGSISPTSTMVVKGSITSFTIATGNGYSIGSVSGCGGSLTGNTYTTAAITTACTVSATFTINSYTITATAGDGGSISPPSQTLKHGETASFTVTANTGYSIGSVSGCGGSLTGNTYTTAAITTACTVSATFTINSYTITATAGEGGSITPPSQTVNHGETASFTVTANAGYSIGPVIGCGGILNGGTYTTGEIVENCTVLVNFIYMIVPPEIVIALPGNGSVTLMWGNYFESVSNNVYYGTEPYINPSNGFASKINEVNSPHVLTGLENDITYYFVVTSFVGDLESKPSNEVEATPMIGVVDLSAWPLNDTGIDWCADDVRVYDCILSEYQGQDADHGRDFAQRLGYLYKAGGGEAGFDLTKLDRFGSDLSDNSNSWSCVRDNHTGLVWENKTTDGGLRDKTNLYSWFNPDNESNGGHVGIKNGGNCSGSDCDTHGYVKAINYEGLCGHHDWRLPNIMELISVMNNGQIQTRRLNGQYAPAIDVRYFPNAPLWVWSSIPYSYIDENIHWAWHVSFLHGDVTTQDKSYLLPVVLVRGRAEE